MCRQRRACWQLNRQGTSYPETDRALTAMKKDPGLAFLNEVSSVPLQQALLHIARLSSIVSAAKKFMDERKEKMN